MNVVNEFIELCKPNKVTIITDSQEDIQYVRDKTIEKGEETKLETEGHTIHYDGFFSMTNQKRNGIK